MDTAKLIIIGAGPAGLACSIAAAGAGLDHGRTLAGHSVVVATGFFDTPVRLGVPGEELPKCSHYFHDGHPYYGRRVAVVGGGNSAVETTLELQRAGAG